MTATNGIATVLAGGNVSQAIIAGTWASVTAMGSLTGNVTGQSGTTNVLVIGSITANVSAGLQGTASITAGGAIQGNMSAGQNVSVTTMGNIGGSVSAGSSATVTALGNESGNITAGNTSNTSAGSITASVFAYGTLSGSITTASGDISATAEGSDSAAVNAAGNATVEVFDQITGNVTAGGSVEVDGASTIQDTVNAGNNALVTGVGDIDVSGQAGSGSNGGSYEVDGVASVNASITATGAVMVSAGGDLSGMGDSTTSDVNATAGGGSTFDAHSDQGNATVSALGALSGTIMAALTATGNTFGQAGNVTIIGNQQADLNALGGGDATVDSSAGNVNIFAGGNMALSTIAYNQLEVGSDAELSIDGTSSTGDIAVTSVGDLSGTLTATDGSVTALSVGNETAVISAGTDATAFAGITLGGGITAGQDVQAVSYGNIAALPAISAGHDLWLFGAGNVSGVFYAGNSIRYFTSDGSIQANITVGSGSPSSGDGNYGIAGVDYPITAWGKISGTITAATSIGIQVGGTISATLTAPDGATSETQNQTNLIGTKPVLGDVGQAALAAAVKGLVAQGQQMQSQIAQQATAIQLQLSAEQDEAQQTYQMSISEFSTAQTQATASLSAAVSAATATLNQAKADDQTALGKANTKLSQTEQQIITQAAAAYASDMTSLGTCTNAVGAAQSTLSALPGEIQKTLSLLSTLQSKSLGIAQNQMSQGKMNWEQTWKSTLNTYMEALVKAQAQASLPTYFGLTADQWVSAADKAVLEAAQKTLDGINGALEQGADMVNLGIKLYAGISGANVTFQINIPDFSNGVFIAETPLEHSLSKMIGGVIVTSLVTAGIGEVLSGLEVAAEAEAVGETAEAAEVAAVEAEAPLAAAGDLDSAGSGSNLCKPGCFVAGTEVITGVNANGTFSQTPIQDVYIGEEVLSQNQFDPSAPPEEEIVTSVEQHTVYELQQVTIEGSDGTTETITATTTHPFYVEGQGWTASCDLVAGNELEQPDGSYASVESSVIQDDSAGVTVYNFTVNNDHTYFVDQSGAAVWVHNDCFIDTFGNVTQEMIDDLKAVNAAGHEIVQDRATVALVRAQNDVGQFLDAVASSNSSLDPGQLAGALRRGLIAIKGEQGIHAEIKAMQVLESMGYSQVIGVVASHQVCDECLSEVILSLRGL